MVEYFVYLGIIIGLKLNFKDHIVTMMNKAYGVLMSSIKLTLNNETIAGQD